MFRDHVRFREGNINILSLYCWPLFVMGGNLSGEFLGEWFGMGVGEVLLCDMEGLPPNHCKINGSDSL